MDYSKKISKVSESPTNPKDKKKVKQFDVADLFEGPISTAKTRKAESTSKNLDEFAKHVNKVE